jgi:hypothetical protein
MTSPAYHSTHYFPWISEEVPQLLDQILAGVGASAIRNQLFLF